ncbi:MAG: hypothetical protein BGO10_08755 [Chlamydia sp. 32-24]|nr:MAG: hypothetical protein BGO10_08755 [Chlamydia sp. 32-24]
MIELKDFSLRYYSFDETTKDIIAVKKKPDSVENTIKKFIKIAEDNESNTVLFEKIRLVCKYIIGKAKSKYAAVKPGFFSGKVFGKSQQEVIADLETNLSIQMSDRIKGLKLQKETFFYKELETDIKIIQTKNKIDSITFKLNLLTSKLKEIPERKSLFPPSLTTKELLDKCSYERELESLNETLEQLETFLQTCQEEQAQIDKMFAEMKIPDLDRED